MLLILKVILSCTIGALIWTDFRFGKVNIEQILSTLFIGGGGPFNADLILIIELIVVILLSVAIPLIFYKRFIKSKLSQYIFLLALTTMSILAINSSFQTASTEFKNINDLKISNKSITNNNEYFNKNLADLYIPITLKMIKPPISEKRNLVLIYVESLETAYRDENLFNKNLLSDLDLIEGIEFKKYEQIFGTGWTMGAIVATQCGVPLRPSQDVIKFIKGDGLDGNTLGESSDTFLRGFICLGDILKNNGYTNVFLGGASGNFGGKHKFFKSHGYDETFGREEWSSMGEKTMNFWGLYDDRLFELAKNKINELNSKNKLFNLTILTVDTHHPLGFLNPTCKVTFPKANFENIVECNIKLVSEFVKYIIANYPNTDIVVIGDHLAMKNPVYDKLESSKPRTIYNKFIFQNKVQKNREILHHYSILPTILYGMGFEFKNGRLALGQSGLHSKTSPVVVEYVEMNDQDNEIINKLYKNAW